MNKVILIGRTTKGIELKYTASNVSVANFSLAVTRSFKNANGDYESDFFNCIAFGKLAETIKSYVIKGDRLGVEGRLQSRSYQNSDGKNVYVTEVIVENIEFLQAKRKETSGASNDPFSDFGESVEFEGDVTIDDSFLD